ncbi:hypothetical protein CC2G_011687 [Coprinopsis cinerea AmutBmut pab1-1]|nr:hypothetical protein CC2G_011687 [Coprinopsis cinerea AmutBmut pab1-1]
MSFRPLLVPTLLEKPPFPTLPKCYTVRMFFSALTITALLALGANAHFKLLYPQPRGPYNSTQLGEFCGGYTNVTTNRTAFPLSGGFLNVQQSHEHWSANVLISTVPNPSSDDDFEVNGEPQYLLLEAHEHHPGNFCIPLDLRSAGIAGLEDGANVTIQVNLFDKESSFYQCADLTLSSTATPDSNQCKNSTSGGHDHGDHSHGSDEEDPEDSGTRSSAEVAVVTWALCVGIVGALSAAAQQAL